MSFRRGMRMRAHPIALVILTIVLAGCADGSGLGTDAGDPPSGTPPAGDPPVGVLLVSTSTSGNSPDVDGYRLWVDDVALGDSLPPTGTIAIGLPPGRHALRLIGTAPQCQEISDPVVQVNVASGDTIPVRFDIRCWATGVLITVSTTGVDIHSNGYGVLVDGAELAHAYSFDQFLAVLQPGRRTIALTDLDPSCTAHPASQTVSVVDSQVTPIAFGVTCTGGSGVVGILIQESGPLFYHSFEPLLDGRPLTANPQMSPGELLTLLPGERHYVSHVQAGNHRVSLAHSWLCSNDTGSQSVTVTGGGSRRDTVNLTFSVTCPVPRGDVATLRISAPTTGSPPLSTQYTVRFSVAGYWDYGFGEFGLLSPIEPNGTRFIEVPASDFNPALNYWYSFELDGVPSNCSVRSPSTPAPMGFTLAAGDTLDLKFPVTCP